MERAVEILAIVNFVVMGLSHMIQHRAWAEFFIRLRAMGLSGVFINGFLSLGFGSLVVAFHNVWSGPSMLLTIFGWLNLSKAAVCFIAPGIALRGLGRVSRERSWKFIPAGALLLLIAGVLGFVQLSTAWK